MVIIELLLVLVATAGNIHAKTDCGNSDIGYTLPCNRDLDPWKETRKKLDDVTSEIESADDSNIWSRVEDGKEKIDFVLDTHETLSGAYDATAEALKKEAVEAAEAATATAEELAETAEGAKKWLQKGAKALKAIASAVQFIGPILDIVLLFAPASKSDELVAIESGFAKIGSKVDAVAYKIDNVQGALDWNTVVGRLIDFEGDVDQTNEKYDQLVEEIKAADLSQELPLEVKGHIEDLVEAIKIQERLAAQRLQYFYEINQQLVKPNDDKGYPKMIYDMYIKSMKEYKKCTLNAVFYAQTEMEVLYGNDVDLTNIIDKMESKYEIYNWATILQSEKEDESFALVDNSARKLEVQLTGISDDDKEKKGLTLFAIKKSSKTQVKDAIGRIQKVLLGLGKADLPRLELGELWEDNGKIRNRILSKVQGLLKKDDVLKSMIDGQQMTTVMFGNESSISLTGWHYKTNMEVWRVLHLTEPGYNINIYSQTANREVRVRIGFTLGFLFSFVEQTPNFACLNGNREALSIDGSFTYCLCNFGYGGEKCDILLKDGPSLSNSVLDVVQKYKVPGMFDLQDQIQKGTDAILEGMENNKLELFAEIKKSGHVMT
ncbi:hypothetical protein ACHWQZ_G008222 [Mnemiopsis leidyi]